MGFLTKLFNIGATPKSKSQSDSSIKADVTLYSPVTGTLLPLDEVPDIVISEKVMGEGVAVIPESEVIVAPCDGIITRLLPTKNAFSVRHRSGLEIYVSFGLEAMEVLGEGFTTKVNIGDEVHNGDAVLQVDSSFLKTKLKSLLTSMIVIKSSATIEKVTAASGKAQAGVSPVVWISLRG